jgi:alpha-galactosidase
MAKVVLVGAGSVLWTPKVLADFHVMPDQPIDEICLMDLNPAALTPMQALASLMQRQTGRDFRVTTESDLDRACRGADYVVVSISVGGLKGMENDLRVAERHGALATVGDTVGPSGYSRLLRCAPVMLDLARRVERAAANAWFINVANPLTPLTRLVGGHTSLRAVGLCCGIINQVWMLQDLLGFRDFAEVEFRVGGIDHCSWFLDLRVRGRDVYPDLRRLTVESLAAAASLGRSRDEWAALDSLRAGFTLFKRLGFLPAISDRHLCEFFPFFLRDEESLARYGVRRTRVADRMEWRDAADRRLRAWLDGKETLHLAKSRDIVADVINALAGGRPCVTTVNYRNQGQTEGLPRESVVETLASVSRDRISPMPAGPLPTQVQAVVLPHLLRQELVLRAALEGSREMLTAALTTDPTVTRLESVDALVEEMIEAQKDLVPAFFPTRNECPRA